MTREHTYDKVVDALASVMFQSSVERGAELFVSTLLCTRTASGSSGSTATIPSSSGGEHARNPDRWQRGSIPTREAAQRARVAAAAREAALLGRQQQAAGRGV